MLDHTDDLVVGLATGKSCGQFAVDRLCLQKQPPGRLSTITIFQFYAALNVVLANVYDFIEKAAGLSRIARDLRHTLLVSIELFEYRHWNVNIVLLEAEQASRVMH